MIRPRTVGLVAALLAALGGCRSVPLSPLAQVPHVELPRFMGDWYVIAGITSFMEKGAHNAVESYRLAPDGTIAVTFTFRAGSFEGPAKSLHPRGFVLDPASNAVWGMQFVWPVKADYRIAYLTPDYSQTVIGREKRDYVWIMARTPHIADADYSNILAFLATQGYDVAKIEKVPQRWPALPSTGAAR